MLLHCFSSFLFSFDFLPLAPAPFSSRSVLFALTPLPGDAGEKNNGASHSDCRTLRDFTEGCRMGTGDRLCTKGGEKPAAAIFHSSLMQLMGKYRHTHYLLRAMVLPIIALPPFIRALLIPTFRSS